MADVQEVQFEKRRWRIWPIVVLVLVGLLVIGILIAMIMNIHGSISWPAGNIGFGFPPRTAVEAPVTSTSPPAQVATDVTPAIAPPDPASEPESVQLAPPQLVTPPADPDTTVPAENTPPE